MRESTLIYLDRRADQKLSSRCLQDLGDRGRWTGLRDSVESGDVYVVLLLGVLSHLSGWVTR